MSIDIVVPELGHGINRAKIATILVDVGDKVAAGCIVAEVMTEKINIEVESPVDGVVGRILFQVGEEVPEGGVIARITPLT